MFADPSGRRQRILRFAGFGSMAVITLCLGAVIVAMSGGPRAPFTQWAGPQVPSSSAPAHPGNQPLGGAKSSPGATGPVPGAPGAASPEPGGTPSSAGTAATPSPSATSPAHGNPKATPMRGKSGQHSHGPSATPTA